MKVRAHVIALWVLLCVCGGEIALLSRMHTIWFAAAERWKALALFLPFFCLHLSIGITVFRSKWACSELSARHN
jgi:hypothetical protein